MKRLRRILLSVIVCAFLACAFLSVWLVRAEDGAEILSPNLMPNGSFEDAIPQGEYQFELQWGAQLYTATGEDDPNVRTGSKSILLDNSEKADVVPFAKNTLLNDQITAGREYVLSMYVKATDGFRGYRYLRVYYNADQGAPVDGQDVHFANNESNVEGVWEKLTYRFTLNPAYGDNVSTVGFRFVFFEGQTVANGKLYLDDISLQKVMDASEVETGPAISVDTTTIANVGYNMETAIPKATATDTDAAGTVTDITSDIKITVRHGEGEGTPVEGLVDIPYTDGWKFTPQNHGYYHVVYTVEKNGQTVSKSVQMNIADTLIGLEVAENQKEISVEKGQELNLENLSVSKILSYSQKQSAAANEYTVDYGTFDKDTAGTYTVTVKMTATYYQGKVEKTDTIKVTVAEEVDHTNVLLTVEGAEEISNVGYGLEITVPEAAATGTNKQGETADVTSSVKVTVQHGVSTTEGMTWTSLEGMIDLAYTDNLKFTPNDHGFFRLIYTVEYAGLTDTKYVQLNIADTLQGFAIAENQKQIYVEQGKEIDWSKLSFTKTLSYSGTVAARADELTFDMGEFDKNTLGTYTVTVKLIANYYQHEVVKTDTVQVTVAEEGSIDLRAAILEILAEGEKSVIGYNMPFTFPDVTATGYNKEGTEANIHDSVKVTLQYGVATATETTWSDVEGFANLDIGEKSRTFTPDRHGFYRLKYEVTYSGKTAVAYYGADIADTLVSLTVDSTVANTKVHKGELPNLNNLEVIANYSYSGDKKLLPEAYEIDYGAFNAESGVGEYTATVILEQVLANGTIRKTAQFTIYVVPDSEEIDYSSLVIKTDRTVDNIPNKQPYTAPDVTVIATDKDGNPIDLHDQVKVTFQHKDTTNNVCNDIVGYVNLPITERTFIADMHGYCRVVYTVEYEGKVAQAFIDLNIMDTLHGISVNTEFVKTKITKGEDLDLSKLVVLKNMSYTGERAVDAGAYTVNMGNFDKNVPGEYTLSVTYGEVYGGEYTEEFTVTVKDVILSFEVKTYPSRTEFSYGEEFNMTGIVAEVVFETLGKQTVPVNEIEIKGYSPRKVGKQTVEFYYDSVKGGSMEVSVSDSFYAVVVDTENVKLVYKKGEALDVAGLKVYKVMVSGLRTELSAEEYTIDAGEFTQKSGAGTYTITVNAKVDGVTRGASFEITVEAKGGCGGCGGSIVYALPVLACVLSAAAVALFKKKA